eukprot:g1310.t1
MRALPRATLLVLLLATGAQGADCGTGKFSADGTGTDDAGACTGCPAGTFNDQTAQTTVGTGTGAGCKNCAAGLYNDQVAQAACKPCARGLYGDQTARTAASGATGCKECGVGKYQDQLGRDTEGACKDCAVGRYNDQTARWFAAGGCKECDVGRFNDQAAQTAVGTGTGDGCKNCAKGLFQDAVGQDACNNCAIGRYNDQVGQTAVGTGTGAGCKSCAKGTYGDAEGQDAQADCKNCAVGTYGDTEALTAQAGCKNCGKGLFLDQEAQTAVGACKNCAKGTYGDAEGQDAQADCKNCAVGTYGDTEALTGQAGCKSCLKGEYLDQEAQTAEAACKNCAKGKFTDQDGQQACKNCAKGTFGDAEGQDAQADCKNCAKGTYGDAEGQDAQADCKNCAADCKNCAVGTYGDTEALTAQAGCKNCAIGKFNDQAAQDAAGDCKDCVMGLYQDVAGQAACKNCAVGLYNDQAAQVTAGDPGTGTLGCKECAAGTLNSIVGQDAADDCKECMVGLYNEQQGQAACKACAVGLYNDQTAQDDATDCKACAVGLYNDQTGQDAATDCKGCVAGKFNDRTGQDAATDCKDCATGQYADQDGSAACTNCAAGYFQDQSGLHYCFGTIVGDLKFETVSPTPGTVSTATIKFTNVGQVPTGGRIEIVLPDTTTTTATGWDIGTPTIAFTTPANVGGTATWTAGTRKLKLTTSTNAIPAGTNVVFTVANVASPSGIIGTGKAMPETYQADGTTKIDGGNTASELDVNAITQGSLSGTTSFVMAASATPGFLQTAQVSLTPAGKIATGGKIEIVMPTLAGIQSQWGFETPAVSWTTPATGAATAATGGSAPAWDAANKRLTITTATNVIASGTAQVFEVTNTRTPSSTTGATTKDLIVTTKDPNGIVIDGGNAARGALTTEAITVGVLSSATFATATDTPGFKQTATVTFSTSGQVQTGGKVMLVMPQLNAGADLQQGWNFEAPAIAFTAPDNSVTASAISFTTGSRTLIFTTGGAIMAQTIVHAFTITNTRTPSSIVAANNVGVTTMDDQDKNIDSTRVCKTEQIIKGTLTSATFATATDTPNFVSTATVTFTTAGQVPAGGTVRLKLPETAGGACELCEAGSSQGMVSLYVGDVTEYLVADRSIDCGSDRYANARIVVWIGTCAIVFQIFIGAPEADTIQQLKDLLKITVNAKTLIEVTQKRVQSIAPRFKESVTEDMVREQLRVLAKDEMAESFSTPKAATPTPTGVGSGAACLYSTDLVDIDMLVMRVTKTVVMDDLEAAVAKYEKAGLTWEGGAGQLMPIMLELLKQYISVQMKRKVRLLLEECEKRKAQALGKAVEGIDDALMTKALAKLDRKNTGMLTTFFTPKFFR